MIEILQRIFFFGKQDIIIINTIYNLDYALFNHLLVFIIYGIDFRIKRLNLLFFVYQLYLVYLISEIISFIFF